MSKINGITVGTTMPRTNFNQTDPKKADYLVGRENILDKTEIRLEKGEVEGSIQQEGAKALGPKTIALGTSVAGCKGYYYSGIDFARRYIYLSKTQVFPQAVTDDSLYDASFSCEWQPFDMISIVNDSHYDEQMQIKTVEGNRVWIEESTPLPFDAIGTNDSSLEDLDAYSICVPKRPECGVINLGEGAFSASDNGKATGRFAVNLARNGRAFGDYALTAGRNAEAAYASGSIGYNVKTLGKGAFSSGWDIESTKDRAVTLGSGLINPYECGTIIGWCNDPTIPDLIFGIGCGFHGVRKNALNIDRDCNVWVYQDPTKPMGVVTKQYADNLVKSERLKRRAGTISAPANVGWYPNEYFVLSTYNGAQVSFTNVTLLSPSDTDRVNEYKMRVNGISKINFFNPDGTVATVKGLPENFEQGKTYELSIIDGYAKYTVWD